MKFEDVWFVAATTTLDSGVAQMKTGNSGGGRRRPVFRVVTRLFYIPLGNLHTLSGSSLCSAFYTITYRWESVKIVAMSFG